MTASITEKTTVFNNEDSTKEELASSTSTQQSVLTMNKILQEVDMYCDEPFFVPIDLQE
jgi:hypothetical protein